MIEERYPVIVTGTQRWVVWVDGVSSSQEAAEMLDGNAYEWIDPDRPPVDGWVEAEKMTAWDMQDVYDAYGPQHDEHVQAHYRELRRRELEEAQRAARETA